MENKIGRKSKSYIIKRGLYHTWGSGEVEAVIISSNRRHDEGKRSCHWKLK